MKEQPQKPEQITRDLIAEWGPIENMEWMQEADAYISHLESENRQLKERVAELENRVMPGRDYYALIENQDLKERIAELERQAVLVSEWCKFNVKHMAIYEGHQDEYDGIYQANVDLLERINGSIPWPDLVIEKLEVK